MVASVGGTASRFSDRVLRFLERVEHRCAVTPAEKEAVYRLRYEAYIREGLIEPRADGQLYDEALDDAPPSTVRVHVASDETGVLPALGSYSDLIMPHLKKRRVIIDLTRFAARLEFARRFAGLPYVALRPTWQAMG